MTNLLKELLQELKDQEAGTINKTAAAPNEPLSPEQQNADVLESSQAMLAKIDNFLQQVNGMGQDNSQETQDTQGTGGGVGNPASDFDTAAEFYGGVGGGSAGQVRDQPERVRHGVCRLCLRAGLARQLPRRRPDHGVWDGPGRGGQDAACSAHEFSRRHRGRNRRCDFSGTKYPRWDNG